MYCLQCSSSFITLIAFEMLAWNFDSSDSSTRYIFFVLSVLRVCMLHKQSVVVVVAQTPHQLHDYTVVHMLLYMHGIFITHGSARRRSHLKHSNVFIICMKR